MTDSSRNEAPPVASPVPAGDTQVCPQGTLEAAAPLMKAALDGIYNAVTCGDDLQGEIRIKVGSPEWRALVAAIAEAEGRPGR